MERNEVEGLSRRKFLRLAALSGAGVLAASCATPTPQVVEKIVKETVVVEKAVEKTVKETVVVEKAVEKTVKETVVVPQADPRQTAKGELRIASINDGSVNAVVDVLVAGFRARYPNVTTKLEYQTGDYTERIYAQAAAGNLPDVIWTVGQFNLGMVANKVLKDLMPLIQVDKEFKIDDIYPSILNVGRNEGDPGLYMLPASYDSVVMYYNKDAFKSAGVENPTEKWTWNDYIQAGLKITSKKGADGKPEMYMLDGTYLTWDATVLPWIAGYGGDYLDSTGTKSTWSSEKSLAGLTAYTDLWVKHKIAVPPGTDYGGNPFGLGKAATLLTVAGWRTILKPIINKKFDFDVQLVPLMPNGKHSTGQGAYGFGLYSGTKVVNVAWDFLKYLNMPATQGILAKNEIIVPLSKTVAEDPSWMANLPTPPYNHMAFVKAGADGILTRVYPVKCGGVYGGLVNQAFVAAIEAVVRGQKDAKTAFTEVDQKVQACLNEAKK